MRTRRAWATLGIAALCAVSAPAAAEDAPPAAQELLARAFHNLYADDYIQTLRFETTARGSSISRRLQLTRKRSQGPGRALLRFLEPPEIRRTSILVVENPDRADDLYVYLPAARLTRHLGASQRADSFFGTDLSYEDVEPKRAEDWIARATGWGEHEGLRCARVEIRPREGFESSYERLDACIEVERGVMLWSDFYRRSRVVKRLEVDPAAIRPIGSRQIPFAMSFATPARRTVTRVLTERYDLRPEIPDELFSTWNLEAGSPERDRARSGASP